MNEENLDIIEDINNSINSLDNKLNNFNSNDNFNSEILVHLNSIDSNLKNLVEYNSVSYWANICIIFFVTVFCSLFFAFRIVKFLSSLFNKII